MSENGNEPMKGEEQEQARTFTQEEVDAIVKQRVSRVKHEPPADYEEMKAKLAEYERGSGEVEDEMKRLQERLGRLESENESMKHERELAMWRSEAQEETGVPASILRGDSEDEVREHARAVKAALEGMRVPFASVNPGKPAKPELTKAQVLSISDPAARRKAIAENIELFG